MSAEAISLLVAGAACPAAAFGANIVVRWNRGIAQSAAADLLLLLFVFDAGVVIVAEQFKLLMSDQVLRDAIIPIHVALMYIMVVVWLMAVLLVEAKIAKAFDRNLGKYASGFLVWPWLCRWRCALPRLSLHARLEGMGSFILIGLGGVAVNATLMTLVAYGCFKAGLLPGVKWRWPFRQRSDVSGAAHALGGRPNIRVNGAPRSLGTRSNIYVGMVQGPPVVEIADVRHVRRVIARDNGSSTYAIAA